MDCSGSLLLLGLVCWGCCCRVVAFFCCSYDVDCSGNIYFVLPLLYLLIIYFLFLLTAVRGERGERARIVDDNAYVKDHSRRHANSYDSTSS